MLKRFILFCLVGCLPTLGGPAAAAIGGPVTASTFDTDMDGWTCYDYSTGPECQSDSEYDCSYRWGGGWGNPGGGVYFAESGDTPCYNFTQAPPKFRGDWYDWLAFGGTLQFDFWVQDLNCGGQTPCVAGYYVVRLLGSYPNSAAEWRSPNKVQAGWNTVTVPIPPAQPGAPPGSGWLMQNGSWFDLMHNVVALRIALDVVTGNEVTALDNVKLRFGPFDRLNVGQFVSPISVFAWGDYDSDSDLDFVTAKWQYGSPGSLLYMNQGGTFVGPPGAGYIISEFNPAGSAAWGDYDNDGYLDLALAGEITAPQSYTPYSDVYQNLGNRDFQGVQAPIAQALAAALGWGDYDNDGRVDLALVGQADLSANYYFSNLYHNETGGFALNQQSGLEPVRWSALAWADYDNDGYLDLAIAGTVASGPLSGNLTRVYRNTGKGTFTPVASFQQGYGSCDALAWGDYDNDGYLDLAMAGLDETATAAYTKVYRNMSGTGAFAATASLLGVMHGSLAWGDYDNDGDLDLALMGERLVGETTIPIALLYRNDGGPFSIAADLGRLSGGELAWGDYDNDGRLDLGIAGVEDGFGRIIIYRNVGEFAPNVAPSPPSVLDYYPDTSDNTVVFRWNPNSNQETTAGKKTPTPGLCYNLRVGTQPGGNDIFSGMADPTSGWRRVPALGNAQKGRPGKEPGGKLSWKLKLPGGGVYYWGVQAIDTSWAGSTWATNTLLQLKATKTGDWIEWPCVYVTKVVDNYTIYVQSNKTMPGIRVSSDQLHGRSQWDLVTVEGEMKEITGTKEKYIDTSVPGGSIGTCAGLNSRPPLRDPGSAPFEPVGLNNKALGGGDWAYNPTTGAGQKGVAGGIGLNNIGMFIKTWGRITQIGPDYLYINDGSDIRDGTYTDYEENVGIRVMRDPWGYYEPNDPVTVIGISSSFLNEYGDVARIIAAGDISPILP